MLERLDQVIAGAALHRDHGLPHVAVQQKFRFELLELQVPDSAAPENRAAEFAARRQRLRIAERQLTEAKRDSLWAEIQKVGFIGWRIRVLDAEEISEGMLRRHQKCAVALQQRR